MINSGPEPVLERMLRKQRLLAWILSILTFALTVGFFALMGFDAPILSRIVLGHSVTMANALALSIIVVFLLAIGLFGRRANRIDELKNTRRQTG